MSSAGWPDDALLLPPGAPIVRGATAIRQALQGLIDQGVERLELRTERLDIAKDTAYEVGFATVHIRLPDGQAIQDPGKYVVVWKRQGADWKVVVDMFNSDTPQP